MTGALLFAYVFGIASVLNLLNGVRALVRGNTQVGLIDCGLGVLGCASAYLFAVLR